MNACKAHVNYSSSPPLFIALGGHVAVLALSIGGRNFGRCWRPVALVIGNAHYPTAPLKNTVNDARW